jgi:hypothetical protein
LLLNQLLANDGGTEAGIQALRPEARVGLALTVHDGFDVRQQVRQPLFCPQSPSLGKGIETNDAALQFVHPFADRDSVPAQFVLRTPLTAPAQELHGSSHKEAAVTAVERGRRLEQVALDGFRKLHGAALLSQGSGGHSMG